MLGHDADDEEEAELNSSYLLEYSGVESRRPQALTAAARRPLLLTSGVVPKEGCDTAAAGEGEGGKGGEVVNIGKDGTTLVSTPKGEEGGDGKVVAYTRRVSRSPRCSFFLSHGCSCDLGF